MVRVSPVGFFAIIKSCIGSFAKLATTRFRILCNAFFQEFIGSHKGNITFSHDVMRAKDATDWTISSWLRTGHITV